MLAPDHPTRDSAAAETVFNTATVTVGGLYLTTHSVVVTLIGTAAATMLTCWTSWLTHRRREANRGDRESVATDEVQDAGATEAHR